MDILKQRALAAAVAGAFVLALAGCDRTEVSPPTANTEASQVATGPVTPAPADYGLPPSIDQSTAQDANAPSQPTGAVAMSTQQSDASLANEVKTKLMGQPELGAQSIEVASIGGIVTLSGHVDDMSKLEQAKSIAQGVDGVKGVDSQLSVQATAG